MGKVNTGMENKIIKNCLMVVGCAASSAFFWLPPWLGAYIGFFLGLCPGFLIQDFIPQLADSDKRIIYESLIATLIGLAVTVTLTLFGLTVGFVATITINILSGTIASFITSLRVSTNTPKKFLSRIDNV